ncbi:MAG: type III-B CRISPR-associated protein Cas10/Cmr2, partial [Sulfolobus sp.]|nr:type III-B CRISPR-associated protein Cas10/Cmr2 [Sulfolobus sp.]
MTPFNVWYLNNGVISSKVKIEKNWTYCSLCNDEPAIVKFTKYFENRVLTYEDQRVKSIIKEMKEKEKDFEKDFKPGEALGPLCLFKRLIYIASRIGNGSNIPKVTFSSVEDVAQSEYIKNVYINLDSSMIKVDDKKLLKDYIEDDNKDILNFLSVSNASDAQKMLENSIKSALPQIIKQQLHSINACGTKGKIADRYLIEYLMPRFYLIAVKGDGDNVGKLISGEIPTTNSYIKLYEKLAEDNKGTEFEKSFNASAEFLKAIINALNGHLLVTPTYHFTLSRTLIFTALNDVKTTVKYGGLVIYVGGDDLLALLPIEASIKAIKEYRENYGTKEKNPFLNILNTYVSAPIAYGKSFGVAIFNMVTHELYLALQRAQDVMEDVAKEVEGKNSVAYTELSTPVNPKSVIPLSYNKLLDKLEEMLNLNLMGFLSTNWGRDFNEIEGKLDSNSWIKMYQYIIKRNTVERSDVGDCLTNVNKLIE